MPQILYCREVTSVLRSRNLVSRLGHEILESMRRTIRPTPTPPAEAASTDVKAPVSASPLALPDPNPSRVLAFFVDPDSPFEDLPCFTPRTLGAGTNNGITDCIGCLRFVSQRGHFCSSLPKPREQTWPRIVGHPRTRQNYSYVHLSGSFIHWYLPRADDTPARHPLSAIPLEHLLPAQEASFNPILILNDPR